MAAEPTINSYERSAGIVLYRMVKNKREYLLLEYSHPRKSSGAGGLPRLTISKPKKSKDLVGLLYNYTSHYWGLCKGIIEQNEDPEQTALREAAEETSYTKIELHPRFREKTSYFFRRDDKYISKSVLWFCGKVLDTHDGKVSFEHTKLTWLPYEKAVGKLTYDNDKRMVQEAEA